MVLDAVLTCVAGQAVKQKMLYEFPGGNQVDGLPPA